MTPDEIVALNPFPGLRAFAVSEAELFFGRQRQIDELVARLEEATLIAVAGASGCGKSSLVLAGLLNELSRRHAAGGGIEWRPVVMRPGNHPIANLALPLSAALGTAAAGDATHAASLDGRLRLSGIGLAEAVRLARLPPHVRVLVVVDQFEEIFRFRRMTDQEEAAAFVKLLLHAAYDPASPVNVVLTLRSDTLGYCADFRDLPEAISRGQYLVPRLTREQRKDAIVGPVELRGFRIAPRLVQRVLNDVSDDFDDLPVMQHALSRTWRRWAATCAGSRPIDVEDYDAIGAAANALSLHADEAYDSLAGLGEVVEKVFRVLTERIGEGTEVRRPMEFDRLCEVTGADRAAVAQVVERYRRADTVFLLPPPAVPLANDPVVDISHESLIRNWTRLKQWADAEALSAQAYRRLADAAALFATHKEALLRDPALEFALDWRARNQPNAAWARLYEPEFDRAMAFLDASKDARDKERRAAQRAAVLKRWMWGLALAGSLLFGFWMTWLWRDSVDARNAEMEATRRAQAALAEAEAARAVSLSRQLALLANTELSSGRLDRALLLGVAAMRWPTEEAQDILRAALQVAPRRFLSGHRDAVSSVAFAPDGKSLASASQDGTVLRWDADTGKLTGQLLRTTQTAPYGQDSVVRFGDDGALLASPNEDGTAILWHASDGEQRAVLKVAPEEAGFVATVVAVDPERRLIALASGENTISLWEMGSGKLRAVLTVPVQRRLPTRLNAPPQVLSLAFSPDGATLAAGNSDHTVLRWDVTTGKPRGAPLAGHRGQVNAVAFSPDGRTLAAGGSDGTVTLWDARTSRPRGRLEAHKDQVGILAFSPDGTRLASGGWDNAVILWDVATGKRIGQSARKHQDRVASLAFSPDGRLLASGSLDSRIILWDGATGEPVGRPLRGHRDQVRSVAFSPDGKTLASAGRDKLVILWDVAGGTAGRPWRGPLQGVGQPVTSVAFSRDGKWLATGHEDHGVYLWNVASANPTSLRLGLHDEQVTSVAFDPEGRWVASASEDHTVRLWDVDSGMQAATLQGHEGKVTTTAFSRDGTLLASGGWDRKVILWNVPAGNMRGKPLDGHRGAVTSVAFSPDGRLLASAGQDKSIKLWDTATGTLLRDLPDRHQSWVTSVDFSPDGRMLASASLDRTLKLWDVATGSLLPGHDMESRQGIWSVAFSSDGRTLVSGGIDSAVRLWDVATRRPVGQPLIGHRDTVNSVAFGPGGRTIASGSADTTVMLWDADVADWSRNACAIAGGDIDPEDWPKNVKGLLKGERPCG